LPWRHRWTVTPSLWRIRCGTSSQCSSDWTWHLSNGLLSYLAYIIRCSVKLLPLPYKLSLAVTIIFGVFGNSKLHHKCYLRVVWFELSNTTDLMSGSSASDISCVILSSVCLELQNVFCWETLSRDLEVTLSCAWCHLLCSVITWQCQYSYTLSSDLEMSIKRRCQWPWDVLDEMSSYNLVCQALLMTRHWTACSATYKMTLRCLDVTEFEFECCQNPTIFSHPNFWSNSNLVFLKKQ